MANKIYVGEVVISTLEADGKWHLSSKIKAFAEKERAIAFVDNWEFSLKSSRSMKFKFGTVNEVEEVLVA